MTAELTANTADDAHAEYVAWLEYQRDNAETERDIIGHHWMAERAEHRTSTLWIVLLVGGITAPTWFVVGWFSREVAAFVARLLGGA